MKFSLILAFVAFAATLNAADPGSRVVYVGGTVAGIANKADARIDLLANDSLSLTARGESVQVPYSSVNTLEYGVRVSRRYVEAVLISPMFLLAKKKVHFLTIGYSDAAGNQQVMVLQLAGADIRPVIVSLEAKTGRRVEYQDEDARRAGKG